MAVALAKAWELRTRGLPTKVDATMMVDEK
jgi:hypothetical protein